MPDLDFLNDLGQAKGSAPAAPNTLAAVFERYGKLFVEASKRNLLQHVPDADAGKLFASIAFDVEIVGTIFTFTINMEDYWQWVNDGRKAGKEPPIKPIIQWIQSRPSIKAKFSLTKKKLKGVKIKNFQGLNIQVPILSAAFGIARNIGEHGIRPTHFFSEVVTDAAVNRLKADISKQIGKTVEINIKESIQSYVNSNKPAA